MKIYWHGFICGIVLAGWGILVYAADLPKTIRTTQQRVSYHNLWVTNEEVTAQHRPRTVILETDYWGGLDWGTVTTFMYWLNDHYLIYTTHTNQYVSGESGALHRLSQWYAFNIDDDPQEEAFVFQVEVEGGFIYQEDESHWEKGWEFRDGKLSCVALDIRYDPNNQSPEYHEIPISQKQEIDLLPQLLTMEENPVIQAWMQYKLAQAYTQTNQQNKAEEQFLILQRKVEQLGDFVTLSGLTHENIPSLWELRDRGFNTDIHVLNPLFLYLMGQKQHWGSKKKK